MANTNSTQGGFLGNLGKIYVGYTGGFIVFTLILAVLEQMGVPNKIIGYCFVFLTIGVYAYIGILSRTMDLSRVLRRRPQGAGACTTAWRPAPTG